MTSQRLETTLDRVRAQAVRVAKENIYPAVQCHMSEADCNTLVEAIAESLVTSLRKDFEFAEAVTSGDIHDHRGRLNGAAIFAALSRTAETLTDVAVQTRMKHLAQNARLVLQSARLFKE